MEQYEQYNIQFDVAEVLEYDYTYRYVDPAQPDGNVNKLFALRVKSCNSYFNEKPFIARPINMNMKRIPLVGEFVLIYRTFNQDSTSAKRRESWYYVTTIDAQSSMNANLLPGISDRTVNEISLQANPGKTFQLKSVSPIQPYEGDFILEGRTGNSIRFSNTIQPGGTYTIQPPWRGEISNDHLTTQPIIVLSNGRKNLSNRKFVAENIQTDDSSLYLTSTQTLPEFGLNNTIFQSKYSASSFNRSQFIGVADRIVLKSKTDVVVLDSQLAVELNAPVVSIGIKKEKEPGLHSTSVENLFKLFLQTITTSLRDSNGAPIIISDPTFFTKYQNEINKLKNNNIQQDTF
jgi:hypothetical protein